MHPETLFFLYGPPGSGKTTLGRLLATRLDLPFIDLDARIEQESGKTVAQLFAGEGEPAFRAREQAALQRACSDGRGVVALGGGALLDEAARRLAEAGGQVLCLNAPREVLEQRLAAESAARPLLGETGWRDRLAALLERRAAHYASFPLRLETAGLDPAAAAREAGLQLGAFRSAAMGAGYDVRIRSGGLDALGTLLRARGLGGPVALVGDSHTLPLYGERARAALEGGGYAVRLIQIEAGEENKTVRAVEAVWQGFLAGGVERGSTVVALGGGVTGDLAGFAAATWLRGVPWVAVPTSLLAMVDASLGGKTGADLAQGKNLIGAFHPPALVLADPALLATLPVEELRSGLGEVVKHGVLADPSLFERLSRGWQAVAGDWETVVRRAVPVKLEFIEADPFERGVRAALNLGHTVGHALEAASGFQLRHGEAVAIGMVVEARLAQRLGLAAPGLAEEIAACLRGLGLPVSVPPGLEEARFVSALRVDKKNRGGKVRFALPVRIGEVRCGVEVDWDFAELLREGV